MRHIDGNFFFNNLGQTFLSLVLCTFFFFFFFFFFFKN